jgi:hypothetical protein
MTTKEYKNEYQKKWYKAHPEKVRNRAKQWYAEHKDEAKEKMKQYRLAHLDKDKQQHKKWRETHSEFIKQYAKQWNLEHPEYMKEYDKQNYQQHKDEILKHNKEYMKTLNGKTAHKKHNAKHREFGFIPLNPYKEGDVFHHLDKTYGIWIPEEIHKSIWHSITKDINMDEINAIAFNYI